MRSSKLWDWLLRKKIFLLSLFESAQSKVLLVFDSDIDDSAEILAVVMPNVLKSGKKPLEDKNELCEESREFSMDRGEKDDWEKYQTTVAEVERLSGFKVVKGEE